MNVARIELGDTPEVHRDLADPGELHRTVYRRLVNPERRPLFCTTGNLLLVQFDGVDFGALPTGYARGMVVEPLPCWEDGASVTFRLRAAPTVCRKEGCGRGKRRAVNDPDEARAWLERKLGTALRDVSFHIVDHRAVRSQTKRAVWGLVEYEGTGVVACGATLGKIVRGGVGTGKGFGFGMLRISSAQAPSDNELVEAFEVPY